jgi:hypothetical protein
MSFLDRLSKKANPRINEYGVIPMLFHIDCNHVDVHGMVRVSNRKLGIKNAAVSFHLKNTTEAPPFTPQLFLEIEAAAESQGYTVHELVSYVRFKSQSVPVREEVHQLDNRYPTTDIHRTAPLSEHVGIRENSRVPVGGFPAGQATTFGSLRHNEVSGEIGAELLQRATQIPRTEEREPFDMHSLASDQKFAGLNVPAFMRVRADGSSNQPASTKHPALERMNAAIQDLMKVDRRAWILDKNLVDLHYAHLSDDSREEMTTTAVLLASRLISNPEKHEELCQGLAEIAHRFDTAEAELSREASK